MLRPSASGSSTTKHSTNGAFFGYAPNNGEKSKYSSKHKRYPSSYSVVLCVTSFVLGMIVRNNILFFDKMPQASTTTIGSGISSHLQSDHHSIRLSSSSSDENAIFATLEHRALLHQQHCHSIGLTDAPDFVAQRLNNHTAHLPQSGIINAIRNYKPDKAAYPYECKLPPETECDETQFTVIFMAYNPDRLQKMFKQIKNMLTDRDFSQIVQEVIVVWNGERHVDETGLGKQLVDFGKDHPLRISYPLKAGFPNDLMNRYHPRLQVKTKAIMYYDDDGPFYSYKATLGGFELWKRNANAQIGAMARKLDLGPRAAEESKAVLNGPGDRFFVSQCPTDELDYNYREFANFGARMVLPSGSFLHSDYLCFLWHPVFEEIRQYVRKHPVNPDDGTVSTLVSQLAGRAPRVYPRRINEADDDVSAGGDQNKKEQRHGRRLMDGINWDAKGAHDKKMNWGRLRSDAANSLARYFGSINSGSIGWCYGTQYQKGEYCKPEMASVGMLPWMKGDHTPRDTCP